MYLINPNCNRFITDILNALHGVLIFCVLVVWRRRVRKELANRRIICLKTPASWAENRDPEEEQLNDGIVTK